MDITNLTPRKQKARSAAMRKNETAPLHYVPTQSDRAPKAVRGAYKHSARERADNEALPREMDVWARSTYSTGDGDVGFTTRPGSMDAFRLPSRGF